ncbi:MULTISPECIES: winged helix-turn-helix transcriptional regulator [Pectobacterium]|uniref:HxlR family transcriptional regulator n=2 Tax=Pectobacterium carotovorum subsp. carotovorum TaxID=555 RepID=A0ABQ5L415_PECCC|nr:MULTISPECIES: helix-turn-helix domain-containing protein [Pectobacterium]KFX02282.1 HxlR family transcriptional regulator [Pectobacterium carotovorum subsp. carotovorum]KHS85606.1 HxlR family transcriptional regulator [Pectobacterium carotovorum subsp. carotovorum]KHT16300.1 HxlR family transcriptional regulator [Pectobacterium carotovorum subsp. carotovorum]KHT32130.1 HxlR family transcriptional regulator [Pectobacterium carotovorum subsp. carotovorum]KHT36130.1 HxlR family transcriptional
MPPEARSKALTEKVRMGELFTVDCPSRGVLKHVSSLWGVLCLISLREGTLRFGELRRKASGVSEKMLAQTLKRLEEDGFVLRFSHPVVPPYVEYSLTPLGREVSEQVATLADWIELNISRVMDSRREKGIA